MPPWNTVTDVTPAPNSSSATPLFISLAVRTAFAVVIGVKQVFESAMPVSLKMLSMLVRFFRVPTKVL